MSGPMIPPRLPVPPRDTHPYDPVRLVNLSERIEQMEKRNESCTVVGVTIENHAERITKLERITGDHSEFIGELRESIHDLDDKIDGFHEMKVDIKKILAKDSEEEIISRHEASKKIEMEKQSKSRSETIKWVIGIVIAVLVSGPVTLWIERAIWR